MHKFSVVSALIGASQAATPSPVANTDYPKYATLTVPATTGNSFLASTGSILPLMFKSGAVPSGLMRGFRNDLAIFPTQTLLKPVKDTASAVGTIVASGATRTFWQTTAAEVGTYPQALYVIATNDGDDQVTGATWVACVPASMTTSVLCQGAVYYQKTATVTGAYAKRIAARVGISSAQTVGTTVLDAFAWNEDLLMASFYHVVGGTAAVPKTDATAWCTPWNNKALKDGTELVITATSGFNGASKCTWFIYPEDGTVGPAFQLKSATWAAFLINWIEWASVAGLGTNGVLPAADGASYHLGAYSVAAKDVWLNPLKTGVPSADVTWKVSAIVITAADKDYSKAMPGSIGSVISYTGAEGQFKETQTVTVDQAILAMVYGQWKGMYDSYTSNLTPYNKELKTYNEKNALAVAEKSNNKPGVPQRPCNPTRPMAWTLANLDLSKSSGASAAWAATATLQKNLASLVSGSTNIATDVFHTRSGFVSASADSAAVPPVTMYSGHIFGKLGQGAYTSYANDAMPFFWGTPAAANLGGMLVSFFPATDADTGLAAVASTIVMNAKAIAFQTVDKFAPPAQPADSVPADKRFDVGAQQLAASLVATVAVIASLY